jgi:E3 ubiquitin-protein ligase NEDD4
MPHDEVGRLGLDFSVVYDLNGKMVTVNLDCNDSDPRELTAENVHEFVELRWRRRVELDVGPQLAALVGGFSEIVPIESLQSLSCDELELLMSGAESIDIKDWRENTDYIGAFKSGMRSNQARKIVTWFWEWIESLDTRQRQRFLRFVTGSSGVPYGGFACLLGNDGRICRFTLQPIEQETLLPRAHTCFNRLDLPIYKTKDELFTILTQIISIDCAISGFGIE